MGRHLGTHFSLILVGLGGQVGRQNGAKIDAKRHRKNDGKKRGGGSGLGGLGFIPSLIRGILRNKPLAWKILCISRRVFRMCGRDLMC